MKNKILGIIFAVLFTSGCAIHLNEISVSVNEGGPPPEVGVKSSSYGFSDGQVSTPTVDADSRQSGDGVNVNINIANPSAQDQTLPVTIPVKPF